MKSMLIAAGILAAGTVAAAADDLAQCNKGIAFIEAQIAAKPADAVLKKLQKALRDAKRELGEGEFDECLDAVKDAEKATGKKA